MSKTARSGVDPHQADELAKRLRESRLVSNAAVANEIRAAFEVLPPVQRTELQAELAGLFRQPGLSIDEHATLNHVLGVLARCRFLTDEAAQRAMLKEAITWTQLSSGKLKPDEKEQLADAITAGLTVAMLKITFEDGIYSTRLATKANLQSKRYLRWVTNTGSTKRLEETHVILPHEK